MKVHHILVPTDFSERSIEAIEVAGFLVDFYGCTVDLIHTVPMMQYFHDSMDPLGVPFSIEKELYPHSLENAKKRLETLAEKYIKKEYRGKMIAHVERKPSDAIAEQANRGDYDLVLMASRGSHNSIHLMGGTTEKTLRHCNVPVLTIDHAMNLDEVKRILVPIDMSEESFFSVIPAFELARELGATIELLNVIELYSAGSDMIPYMPNAVDEQGVYENMVTRISEYLINHEHYELYLKRTGVIYEDMLVCTEGVNSHSVELKSKVVKGISAHREISDYANEHADLVVMSTHGRTGISRVLIGSTTEQVSRQIQKPLLTVRPSFYEREIKLNREERAESPEV